MKIQKPRSLTLSVADLLALAGVTLTKVTVDRSGTDDSNAVTLRGAEGVIVFPRDELIRAIREADGYVASRIVDGVHVEGHAPATSRLPMGRARLTNGDADEGERDLDGWPQDHVEAAITIDRSGTTDADAVTLRWME